MEEAIRLKRDILGSLCDKNRKVRILDLLKSVAYADGSSDALKAHLLIAKWYPELRAKEYYAISEIHGENGLHLDEQKKYLQLSANEYAKLKLHGIAGIVFARLGECHRDDYPLAIRAYLAAEYEFKLHLKTDKAVVTEITTCRIALARLYASSYQYDLGIPEFDRAIGSVGDEKIHRKLVLQKALAELQLVVPYGDPKKCSDVPIRIIDMLMMDYEEAKASLKDVIRPYDAFEIELIVRAVMKKFGVRDRIRLAI